MKCKILHRSLMTRMELYFSSLLGKNCHTFFEPGGAILDIFPLSPNSFVLRIPLVTFLRSIVADLLAFFLLLFVASLVIYQYLPPPPPSDWPLLLANWGHQLQNFCDIIFSCVFRSIWVVRTWNHLPDLFFIFFSFLFLSLFTYDSTVQWVISLF